LREGLCVALRSSAGAVKMRAEVPCIGQMMRLGERLEECLATLGNEEDDHRNEAPPVFGETTHLRRL
jgi:hypothetical protein